jgi:predicted nuclease of predicted toxin-antitoxin system
MLDENTANSLAVLLADEGHEVLRSVEAVGEGADDQSVAKAALVNACVLVTGDPDFRRTDKWSSDSKRRHFSELSVIIVNMQDPTEWGPAILKNLPLFELEQNLRVQAGGSPWFFGQVRDKWVNLMKRAV